MARIGLVLAGLGVAAALTACGGDDEGDFADQPAEDIVNRSKTEMGELEAVKVSGSITSDGQDIAIDLQASSNGDCTGSIKISDGTAELLGVGGSTWMKPDEAFWRSFAGASADQVLAQVGDKWVVVPPDDDSFNEFCDIDDLLDELLKEEEEAEGTKYTVTGTDELDGDEVVLVDNEDPDEGTWTGYILVDEPHYLVKLEKTEGEDTGTVTFSEFDEQFDVEAPAEDDVVDLGSLS